MKIFRLFVLSFLVYSLIGLNIYAQQKPKKKQKESKYGPKAYSDVITKDAITSHGLFNVHKVKDKYYFEIPLKEFDKDFLLVTTQAETQAGVGYQGDAVNHQVVRWERMENKILLRSEMFAATAADSLPVSYSVKRANQPPVIMAFNLKAFTNDSSAIVIDVTSLFSKDVAELGLNKFARKQYKVKRLDPKRSFINYIKAFPDNLEIEATMTYSATQVPDSRSLSTITLTIHNSMVRLPERPMLARLEDKRVGYFTVSHYDYGFPGHHSEKRTFITKWRLEPKDTAAFLRGELVEPVKPIVFYIGKGVPDKWRPWLHKAVEDWNVAFEKAGFKHAIVAKDPPSEKEDIYWSSDDARYSVIRWLASNVQNAYGPHISDPRTGEILDADIGIYHNVMNLIRNWYFIQASPNDPAAQKLPLPDSLIGRMLEYVVTHEVGHSLGFPHNMKASSQYPVDSLRSATFTAKYGTESSIMDYGRFNYVAQPGDNASLFPIIGPYDKFALEWGYRPIIGAKTPEEEKPALNKIVSRQETEPYLRFGSADGIDPTAQTEDLGSDAIVATKYGLKNLKRVMGYLLKATTQPGQDYSNLKEMYNQVYSQRIRELGHVANYIGGIITTQRYAGDNGKIYEPLSKSKQKAAMAYLQKEAFYAPKDLIRSEILALIEPDGNTGRILQGQKRILNILLNNDRLSRLINTVSIHPGSYTLEQMLTDLQKGIWSELKTSKISINIYRRNFQRAYLNALNSKLNPKPKSTQSPTSRFFRRRAQVPLPSEAESLIRYKLINLSSMLKKSLSKKANAETKAQIQFGIDRIQQILYPSKKN